MFIFYHLWFQCKCLDCCHKGHNFVLENVWAIFNIKKRSSKDMSYPINEMDQKIIANQFANLTRMIQSHIMHILLPTTPQ